MAKFSFSDDFLEVGTKIIKNGKAYIVDSIVDTTIEELAGCSKEHLILLKELKPVTGEIPIELKIKVDYPPEAKYYCKCSEK